ncbi:MAG: lipopolysaccharide biosynthesis protein [Porcipelethomonas sp.]
MENKDERYLNITLKNDDNDNDNGFSLSISSIIVMMKKFFSVWIAISIIMALIVFVFSAVNHKASRLPLTALVSFTYEGIESGLDPSGNSFDINSMKSPTVIEAALTELERPLDELESIRKNITFEGIMPDDAVDRISAYKSIFDNSSNSSLAAAQAMLETSYYPTQYKVYFDYANTNYSGQEAAQIINTILKCYRDYFLKQFGYNEAMGNAITSVDYDVYDYAEAVDVFDSTLKTMKNYVSNLSASDTTRFRSNTTGYTFSDLSEAISTLQTIDLDVISSYITVNNITKDKESLMTYYQYRIDSLERSKKVYEDQLAAINDSIDNYQKDTITILGNENEGVDTSSTIASPAYDKMFEEKLQKQTELSTAKQQIVYYQERMDALKDKPAGTSAQAEKVVSDLSALNDKINKLIDDVNKTSNEYYENVAYSNAYNILVPANSSEISTVKNIISFSLVPLAVAEVCILVLYFGASFVMAIIYENKKAAQYPDNSDKKDDSRKNKKQDK